MHGGKQTAKPRVVFVVGTRPEAIKLAPVVLCAQGVLPLVVATSQHSTPAIAALARFGVAADVVVDLPARRSPCQAHLVGRLLPLVADAIERLAPDAVVVQGDTASALCGALAAHWLRVPVVHVEAGLRSFDRANPFPEETYRRMIAVAADLHLAPTPGAVANLIAEGADPAAVVCTGNTIVDATRRTLQGRSPSAEVTATPGLRTVLVTVHRREVWGEPLADVLRAIESVVRAVGDIEVILPVHPNPAVADVVRRHLGEVPRVRIVDPLDHRSFLSVLARSVLVLTDSGGVQEEAPTLGVPTLVLRSTTERPEAVAAGVAELVGTDAIHIIERAKALLLDEAARRAMATAPNPFGDGAAGGRANAAIRWWLGLGARPLDWAPPLPSPVGGHLCPTVHLHPAPFEEVP